MPCETVRELLNRLADGERLSSRAEVLAVWRHCLGCSQCREARRRYRRLRRLSRSLPRPVPPASLRENLLAALPPAPPIRESRGDIVMKRVRIAAVATVVLGGAMLVLPHMQPAVNAAEKVRQSLLHVNTWHLRGWKLVAGKQVAWEIWGRKTPFFYREEVGGDIVVDDGQQRTRVLGPDHEIGRDNGIVIQTPSQRDLGVVGEGFTNTTRQTFSPGAVEHETATEVVFKSEDDIQPQLKRDFYTISKQTWLPVRYDVRAVDGASATLVEHLDADYDQPLAVSLSHVDHPAGYLMADGAAPAESAALPHENIARDGDLTVQLTPLAMDNHGCILARVRGWLGDVPILAHPLFMHVLQAPYISVKTVVKTCVDNRNRPYILAPVEALRLIPDMNPGVDHLIYLAPLAPMKRKDGLPHHLRMMLQIAPWIDVKQSGEHLSYQQCPLMSTNLVWNLELPAAPRVLNPDAYLPAGWRERVKTTGNDVPSLDTAVAAARSQVQRMLAGQGLP